MIVKNFWLKVSALLLAVIAWFYVVGELNKGTLEETALFGRIMPYKIEAKEVPIKVNLVGKPLARCRILSDRISIKPSTCVIIAPKNLLSYISGVTTEEIDISDCTRSIFRQVKIRPIGPGIILEKEFFVNVIIPIEKVEEEARVKK